jgi:hypothetical protein
VAKKPNYNFEKNRREQEKKRKKEEKRLRRLENSDRRPDDQADGDADAMPPEAAE